MNEANIKKLARHYDIVSLDIFDTTLIRMVNKPEDVYSILGQRCSHLIGENNIYESRILAQKNAELRHQEFTNIEHIYDEFNNITQCGQELAEQIKNCEIEIEKQVCVLNPEIKEYIEIFKKCGLTIIFVSDMYLSDGMLSDILRHAGVKENIKVYVSNCYGKTKRSGKLFKEVALDYPGKRIIHIGDSLLGDCIMPCFTKGIKGIRYNTEYEESRKISRYILKGKEDPFYWGYSAFGPILWDFCEWIDKITDKEKVDKILFLSREGVFFYDIYKIYKNDSKKKDYEIAYFSRKSLSRYISVSGDDLDKDNDDLKKSDKTILSEYLKQLDVQGKVAVVDIGWKGSMQLCLSEYLSGQNDNIQLIGVYFGCLSDDQEKYNRLNKTGFLSTVFGSEAEYQITNAGYLFEALLTPNIGTTLGYKKHGDMVGPILDSKIERNASKDEFQEGIIQYFNDMLNSDRTWIINVNAKDRFVTLLDHPTKEQSIKLGDITWREGEKVYYIAKPKRIWDYLINPKVFKEDFFRSGWKSAFCKRLFCLNLPYYHVYKKLKEGRR